MALYTTFAAAGDGQVTGSSISSRTFRVEGGGGYYEIWFEETYSETTRWVGLTAEAAQEPIDDNGQPEDPNATYSYTKTLDNAIIGAYSVERVFTRITKTLTENGDLASPTFDPMGESTDGRQNMHDVTPFSVDIASDADTVIWYRIGQWTGGASGYYVYGDWVEDADNAVTVELVPSNTYGDPYYRLVRLEAYARKLVSGEYIVSGTLVQDYRDDLEMPLPTFDPDDGGNYVSWNNANIELDVEVNSGFVINYEWKYWNNSDWIQRADGTSASNTQALTLTYAPGFNGAGQYVKARSKITVGTVTYYGSWDYFSFQIFSQAGP